MPDYGPTPSPATPQPLYAVYKHGAHTVDFIPDSSDYGGGASAGVPCGAVIVQGSMVGIALIPLPMGKPGALCIQGCFEFPKAASDGGLAAGQRVYWDATNHIVTWTPGGNTYLGKVETAAATAATTVRVQVLAAASGINLVAPTTTGTATG